MRDDDLRKWSSDVFGELRAFEYGACRILNRCCRAALSGAVKIDSVEDPVLFTVYRPRLNHCPECGRRLD